MIKAIVLYGLSDIFHQAHIITDIVNGIQHHSQYFTGKIKMP